MGYFFTNTLSTQKQNNQEYDQENSNFQQKIKSLTTDQHATGSSFFMNGSDNKNGYMKIDYNYDVTYHYNMATDQIIVTNIKINLNLIMHYMFWIRFNFDLYIVIN